jgi:Mor family transcriptional regulator
MKHKNAASKNELFVSPREYFSEMVETGLNKRNLKTYPAVQKYLVDLLEHYLDARNLYDETPDQSGQRQPSTLAEMYLRANNAEMTEKRDLLKKLGDRSLYISGFFGDSLDRKIVDIEYYADMGGAAYESLAHVSREDTTASVYRIFSKRFLEFVDVLSYISQQSFVQSDQSILRLYDRYLRTGSELAREKLIEMGVVTVSKDHIKLIRQD